MSETGPDDFELFERWQHGDKRAGQILLRRHYISVRKFFINSVHDEDARDLTQKTFLKVTEKGHQFKHRASFRTYLFSIARFTLYDFIKSKQRARKRFEPLEHSVVDFDALRPSDLVSRIRRHDMLLDHMRALPLETKQLLELYYWQDFTANELGEVFDRNPSTLKGKISAAKKTLAKAMRQPNQSRLSDGEIEIKLRELGKLFEQGPPMGPEDHGRANNDSSSR